MILLSFLTMGLLASVSVLWGAGVVSVLASVACRRKRASCFHLPEATHSTHQPQPINNTTTTTTTTPNHYL
jgi:hypothetical protein